MKYKKKPIVIEAVQCGGTGLFNNDFSERPEWLRVAISDGEIYKSCGNIYIRTLEGDFRVSINDYIIRGIDGEIYSCKPGIFERTYELVESGE